MANQWVKMYTEILHDRKMRKMTERQQLVCLKVILLAGQEDLNGELPSLEDISLELYMPNMKQLKADLDRLCELNILSFDPETEIYTVINFAKRQESNLTGYERVKRYRENQKRNINDNGADVINDNAMITQNGKNDNGADVINESKMITVEKEEDIDKEKDKEYINSFSNEKEYTRAKKDPKDRKSRYGTFDNVWLTNDEYLKLQQRFPDWADRLEAFGTAKKAKGYVYKSDYAAILNWARMDEEKAKAAPVPKTTVDYLEGVTWEGMDDE